MVSSSQAVPSLGLGSPNSAVKSLVTKKGTDFSKALSSTVLAARSAYVPRGEPYSLDKHGSHRVGGIELVPGAPGYDFKKALPYLKEIAGHDSDLAEYLKRQGVAASLGDPVNPVVTPVTSEEKSYVEDLLAIQLSAADPMQSKSQFQQGDDEEAGEELFEEVVVAVLPKESEEAADFDSTQSFTEVQFSSSAVSDAQLDTVGFESMVNFGAFSDNVTEHLVSEELFSVTELLATKDYLNLRNQEVTEDLLSALNSTEEP